jgi:hypothetical protein
VIFKTGAWRRTSKPYRVALANWATPTRMVMSGEKVWEAAQAFRDAGVGKEVSGA